MTAIIKISGDMTPRIQDNDINIWAVFSILLSLRLGVLLVVSVRFYSTEQSKTQPQLPKTQLMQRRGLAKMQNTALPEPPTGTGGSELD